MQEGHTYVARKAGKFLDRFTLTGPQRKSREMERSADIKPRIEALELKLEATRAEDVVGHRKIVVEAMKLYQACKTKYLHFTGKYARYRVGTQVGIVGGGATAVVTGGVSCIPVALFGAKFAWVNNKRTKWKELKNKCKAIGEEAAQHADIGFTRTHEGIITFLRPFAGLPKDISDMLNDVE